MGRLQNQKLGYMGPSEGFHDRENLNDYSMGGNVQAEFSAENMM